MMSVGTDSTFATFGCKGGAKLLGWCEFLTCSPVELHNSPWNSLSLKQSSANSCEFDAHDSGIRKTQTRMLQERK